MWFIGVEVEQETSAPPPKKNPGSAPAASNFSLQSFLLFNQTVLFMRVKRVVMNKDKMSRLFSISSCV